MPGVGQTRVSGIGGLLPLRALQSRPLLFQVVHRSQQLAFDVGDPLQRHARQLAGAEQMMFFRQHPVECIQGFQQIIQQLWQIFHCDSSPFRVSLDLSRRNLVGNAGQIASQDYAFGGRLPFDNHWASLCASCSSASAILPASIFNSPLRIACLIASTRFISIS
ncbi:hypothetical protein D3C79_887460 [compost metagenome]